MIQEEQQELIKKYVQANAYYQGNEDLLSEFCNEAFQKTYLIFNTSNDAKKTEAFISKIVNTTIINILKQKQRYIRPIEEKDTSEKTEIPTVKETKEAVVTYNFPDPLNSIEDVVIKRELLQKIVDTVCIIHKEIPHKLYYDIFYQRYLNKKTQTEISQELNIPESEVSKRLLHLSKLVSSYLYQK